MYSPQLQTVAALTFGCAKPVIFFSTEFIYLFNYLFNPQLDTVQVRET